MAFLISNDHFHGIMIMFLFLFISSAIYLSSAETPTNITDSFKLRRSSFPPDFLFGAASSAYQYEGAAFIDGKGPSIWDVFCHQYPHKIADGSNGDVAEDFYHRYKEDIKLMKSIGLDSFRFSISWPRLIPTGKLHEGVNQQGIDFYNNVINELLANGIKPLVTIFHWDLPQALQEEYGGFLSSKITEDFLDFAELCFQEFGDRVKFWSTFNEPVIFSSFGFDTGILAPGRCSAWRNNDCLVGNSATEPYIVGHNILLSHAATAKLYREKYKSIQEGQVGIVLPTRGYVPLSSSKADIEATQRAIDFFYGWFADPLVLGEYPQSMRRHVGKRLPKFTTQQSKLLKGSFDFIGLNYYSSSYAADGSANNVGNNVSYTTDSKVLTTNFRNGQSIGDQEDNTTYYVYPKGLFDILVYTKKRYNNPTVYITENGYFQTGISTLEEGVNDIQRVNFYKGHLEYLKKAIDAGSNVKGFYPWSFLDTFEWNSGYTYKIGLIFIDYLNGLKRYPKLSAQFYQKFLSS